DRAPGHEGVARQRPSVITNGLEPVRHGIADPRKGLGLEQRLIRAVGRYTRLGERLVKERVSDGADASAHRPIDGVLEGEDVGTRLDGLFPTGRLQVDSAAPPTAQLSGVGWSGPNDFHAGFLEMLAQAIEEAKPEHGRRKRRNLEDGTAEFALESLIDIRVVGEAENGRQADSDVVTIAAEVPGGHRLGIKTAWFRCPDGGGEEQVAIEASPPPESSLLEPFHEKRDAGAQRIETGARIGMIRMIGDQGGNAGPRVLHRL